MKIPEDLKRFNLVSPLKPARRRLVMTSEGGPGSGKSDFFYRTFPKPALVIQLDLNDEGIRERYEDEDILIKEVIVPPFVVHDEAQRGKDMLIANELRDLYRLSIDKDYFRSIMIDEGDQLYELARRAFLLSLDFGDAPQQSYAPINGWMKRFYTLAKQHRVNLYIPHRQTEERVEAITRAGKKTSTPTGRKIISGWKKSLYDSQCHVVFEKDITFDPSACTKCNAVKSKCSCDKFHRADPLSKFSMRVTKCTSNTLVEGFTFTGEDITLANLGQMIWPTSEESDWQ